MKKFFPYLFALLLAFTSLSSCSSGNDPKEVAQDFMEALAKQDFDKARELGTEQTKAFISLAEAFIKMMPEEEKKKSAADVSSLKWGETEIKGDQAIVHYTDPEGKPNAIELRKVDGKWKVDMKKEM